ncbi:NAD(P)H-binding protein [soil metagenome]
MSETIFITSSTGKTGSRVTNRLNDLKLPVQLGSRKGNPAFDWEKPELFSEALQGVTKAYITFQPDLAVPAAIDSIQQFVTAAKKAGLKKLVLLSGRGEKEAQACEDIVIESSIDYTILRASWFMQNFSENFLVDGILERNVVLPTVSASEPFVNADDIADVVVQALINPLHKNKIYELTGPNLLSFEQAVRMISEAINSKINFQYVSIDDYVGFLKSQNIPDDYIWLIRYLFTEVLDGRNESVKSDVETILERPASSFKDYLQKTVVTNVWNNEK